MAMHRVDAHSILPFLSLFLSLSTCGQFRILRNIEETKTRYEVKKKSWVWQWLSLKCAVIARSSSLLPSAAMRRWRWYDDDDHDTRRSYPMRAIRGRMIPPPPRPEFKEKKPTKYTFSRELSRVECAECNAMKINEHSTLPCDEARVRDTYSSAERESTHTRTLGTQIRCETPQRI